MSEAALNKFIDQLANELAPFVENDFKERYLACLAAPPKRALRLNALRIFKLGLAPLLKEFASNNAKMQLDLSANNLQAKLLDFLMNWPEFQAWLAATAKTKTKTSTIIDTTNNTITDENNSSSKLWQAVPWANDGFYLPPLFSDKLAKSAAYKLGLFYLQESSAMLPANLLAVKPGELVADLCAAPGGKSSKLAADLLSVSGLISNDISASRAKILLRNLNQLGVWHNCVLNANFSQLLDKYHERFDAIVIDAPCSGEGMIRRDKKALAARLEADPFAFQQLQLELLEQAWQLLKVHGRLVYSTCTFNLFENEAVILEFLNKQTDARLLFVPAWIKEAQGLRTGFAYKGQTDLQKCLRIFPQDNYGEGHFAALLYKEDSNNDKANAHKSEALIFSTRSNANLEVPKPQPFLIYKPINETKYKQKSIKTSATLNSKKARNFKKQAAIPNGLQDLRVKDLMQLLEMFFKQTLKEPAANLYLTALAKYPYFKLVGDSLEWLVDFAKFEFIKESNRNFSSGYKERDDFNQKSRRQKHETYCQEKGALAIGATSSAKYKAQANEQALHYLSQGLWLGQVKAFKGGYKFIPAHNLALTMADNASQYYWQVDVDSSIYEQYLAGASFQIDDLANYGIANYPQSQQSHYGLLIVSGYVAGWLQFKGNQVLNLYPKGWIESSNMLK